MSQYTVLCVDTDDAVEELRAAVAAADQLTPLVRSSVEGAHTALDAESVDCVVTAHELPDGGGLSVIEAVRNQQPGTPCILFTAVSPSEIETAEFSSVVVEYLNSEQPDALDRLRRVILDSITHNSQAGFLLPNNEAARLEALEAYDVDSLPVEESFDRLTGLVSTHFDVAVSFIGLIDRATEQFIACRGADWEQLPREKSICTHSMLHEEVMVVEDIAADGRFRNNETLHELDIVSYAGANLTTPAGETIGQLCVIDHEPRSYSETERADLQAFADTAMEILELRHQVDEPIRGVSR